MDQIFFGLLLLAFLGFFVHLIVTRIWILHAVVHVSERETTRLREKQERINQSLARLLEDTDRAVFQERQIREAFQWYSLLSAHLPGMVILIFDEKTRYVLAMGESIAKAGYDPKKMIGRTLREVITHPERASYIGSLYARALSGEIVREDGYQSVSGHRFDITLVPLRNDAGAIVGGMAISVERNDG